MKIGLVLPMGSHSSTPEPYSFIKSFTKRAEESGFDAVWAFEHVIFRMPGQAERGALEAWTIMAMLGEATTRIEIGSLVLGMRFRNPALLAKMAVTLDDAIGGRLTLGVSAGWHGLAVRDRKKRFRLLPIALTALLGAALWPLWPYQRPDGIVAAAIIATAVQIVSPWSEPASRYAQYLRLAKKRNREVKTA